jgi:hypothetical protein
MGHVVFDRRLQSPTRALSFRLERLEILAAELSLLFANTSEGAEPFCAFSDAVEPMLHLGQALGLSLYVEIEPIKGFYVLYDTSPSGCTVITASEERLIDHIVSVVACATGELTPRTADGAVDVLVGRSLEDVERRLILRTALHFGGHRQQMAFALGLDDNALTKRVGDILAETRPQTSSEERQ